MPVIGLLDTSGIQRFLYRSPVLRDIAAASEYIEKLTEKPDGKNPGGLFYRVASEVEETKVIVSAGGNAGLTAPDRKEMEQVFRLASRELLDLGIGLELVGAIYEYTEGNLAAEYRKALVALEKRKLTQARSTDFVFAGLGPSIPRDRKATDAPNRIYKNQLWEPRNFDYVIARGTLEQPGVEKPHEEQFGLMGVVSMDGLGMGKKLLKWLQEMEASGISDNDFSAAFDAWSDYLKKRWLRTWEECLDEIDGAFPFPSRRLRHPSAALSDRRLQLQPREEGGHYLPCRRIYQGGDDMVFVCDARVALTLTQSMARRLSAKESSAGVPEDFQSIPVSAGVAFVDSHFPFSRAQDLADNVRKKAKKKAASDGLGEISYVNWWINREGSLYPIERESSQKPYKLAANPTVPEAKTWEHLERQVLVGMWRSFGDSRNKLKAILAEADTHNPKDGARNVRTLLAARPLEENKGLEFLEPHHSAINGFDTQEVCTPLLDAGELFDFHFPYTMEQEAREQDVKKMQEVMA